MLPPASKDVEGELGSVGRPAGICPSALASRVGHRRQYAWQSKRGGGGGAVEGAMLQSDDTKSGEKGPSTRHQL